MSAYLIWSNEHMGWWGPNSGGYVKTLDEAGRYTREKALRICRDAIPTSRHIGIISEIPVCLADMLELVKGQNLPPEI